MSKQIVLTKEAAEAKLESLVIEVMRAQEKGLRYVSAERAAEKLSVEEVLLLGMLEEVRNRVLFSCGEGGAHEPFSAMIESIVEAVKNRC